ncbi:hypothetical protein [Photobacterium sp.]|uniref:hypothetical protein n=1 Tax=Photobacterium sp. TaxID=660 RepID=UPI00299D2558|nr:hypothetical protein [Photobacterium sp.]MDX1300921.1 hypothetical protein [Photobacterium sp.]
MEQGTVKSHLLQQAEALAKYSRALANSLIQERDCHDVMLGIMQLAMVNKDVIHIHVRFFAHINDIYVSVNPVNNSYKISETINVYAEIISLNPEHYNDDSSPLTRLLELEDKLLELIAEAKDKAEVAA